VLTRNSWLIDFTKKLCTFKLAGGGALQKCLAPAFNLERTGAPLPYRWLISLLVIPGATHPGVFTSKVSPVLDACPGVLHWNPVYLQMINLIGFE